MKEILAGLGLGKVILREENFGRTSPRRLMVSVENFGRISPWKTDGRRHRRKLRQNLPLEERWSVQEILAESPPGKLVVTGGNFGRISPWKIYVHRSRFWQNLPLKMDAQKPKFWQNLSPWELQVWETKGWSLQINLARCRSTD